MVDPKIIKVQLAAINADLPFWVNAEVRELSRLIVPSEIIRHVLNGRYQGGSAILCATDLRLLIVDKKPMFLAVEDVRYDMIAEVNFTHQLLEASIHLAAFNKDFSFTSYRKRQLHDVTEFIQHKLSDVRRNLQDEPRILEGALKSQRSESNIILEHNESSGVTQEQAKEFLPNTTQAWDRIADKLDAINMVTDQQSLLPRRRVTKFDGYQ
ncbi:MAG: PH domain-containing protein [Candidatus Saccharimonadales bacterium]